MLRDASEQDEWLPVLAGRYAAWTGDIHTLAGRWQAIRAALDRVLAGTDAALRLDTCTELERAATDIGDPQLAARLNGIGRRERAAHAAGDARVSRTAGEAADTVLDCVHATIGAEPDATRHRLRLRPRLDRIDGSLAFDELRFGDGSVTLRADVARGSVHIRIEQASGAIPMTVLLEPVIRGTVQAASVDAASATLDARPHDGGTVVPVQLVLDAPRVLQLEVTGDA